MKLYLLFKVLDKGITINYPPISFTGLQGLIRSEYRCNKPAVLAGSTPFFMLDPSFSFFY